MNSKHQLTAEGLEQLRVELEELKNVERPRVIEALKEARAQGDLSENAEYDAARDEQSRLESRIKELENIIKNTNVIGNDNKGATSNLGKTVTVEFPNGLQKEFTIVGSLEADPLINKISNESPVGNAIINKKVGESALVKTENGNEFKITLIKVI